jgi:hypothetical protein
MDVITPRGFSYQLDKVIHFISALYHKYIKSLTQSLESLLFTFLAFGVTLFVSGLVFIQLSRFWGSLLFFVSAFAVGIPLYGSRYQRPYRFVIFALAMVLFILFCNFGLRYDPFAGGKQFDGSSIEKDGFSRVVSVKEKYIKKVNSSYLLLEERGSFYFIKNSGHFALGESFKGYFISAMPSEIRGFKKYLANAKLPVKVGYLAEGDNPDGARHLQNGMILFMVIFSSIAFIIEEIFYFKKNMPYLC